MLPEVLREAASYRMLFYGVAVVLIIIMRPAGLMGYREFSLAWPRQLAAFLRRRKAAAGTGR